MSDIENKKILLVGYGGGHVKILIPIYSALKEIGLAPIMMGLTTAQPILDEIGIPYFSYRDFTEGTQIDKVNHYGEILAKRFHNPEIGISYDESVAYLGVNFLELVSEKGLDNANKLVDQKGRHAFLPKKFMRSVIEEVSPSLVITTNSPRSEHAAILAAKSLKIPTLSIEDLWGVSNLCAVCADIVCVPSVISKDNLISKGANSKSIFVTGIVNSEQNLARSSIQANQPIKESQPTILWAVQHGYYLLEKQKIHLIGDDEMSQDLHEIALAAKKIGAKLLVRPHPNQNAEFLRKEVLHYSDQNVEISEGCPAEVDLSRSDITVGYTSTVLLESVLHGIPIVVLQPRFGKSDMPLPEYGIGLQVSKPGDLVHHFKYLLSNTSYKEKLRVKVKEFFPDQDKSVEKIVNLAQSLL